ncbi:hypothetical protein KGF56_000933 [Candida oxycetoniae]|uniref:HORMA domain-containing protein n=1 Tax=Candida oxycetoniae TaxID=497107 RepID=A0AAI9T0C1_9ASCO|nr:uncharacterized protein KGF56_000933 [Candida oxycetoniae]KAI3406092.2 hypothetical protein KGF56_000933 [Candida oxycetoniae]
MARRRSESGTGKPLTVNNFLLVFREFFTAWLNSVLYYNKVYDQLTFDEVKAFDILLYKSRNPHLDKYINDLVLNIINNMIINKSRPNSLQSVSCLVYDTRTDMVMKSYSLVFSQFVTNLSEAIHELREDLEGDTSALLDLPHAPWQEIYAQFQTSLFKHIQELRQETTTSDQTATSSSSSSSSSNTATENDLFFKITVQLDSRIYPTNEGWVRLNEGNTLEESDARAFTLKPVCQLDLDLLCFEVVNKYHTNSELF